MPTFKEDYSFGVDQEKKTLGLIEKHLSVKLFARGGYATMDFDDGKNLYVELKSRKIRHDKFPTTLIGANKVQFAEQSPSRECWFCWNYTDGVYALKYNKELFDTFEQQHDFCRGDRPDIVNKPQHVYWIPHKHLTKLA